MLRGIRPSIYVREKNGWVKEMKVNFKQNYWKSNGEVVTVFMTKSRTGYVCVDVDEKGSKIFERVGRNFFDGLIKDGDEVEYKGI